MSTPRSIRLAIEACRPCKTSSPRPRLSTVTRTFSSTAHARADSHSPESITQGFPSPPTPEAVPKKSAAQNALASSVPDAPSRRPRHTVARPNASSHEVEEESAGVALSTKTSKADRVHRPPRNVAAAYLTPLRRRAEYGVPSCDLQLRSYSVRNVEFMADFAMRAAYYLGLPASGPTPLPKIIERWTMPRSNFAHKKSQENFERITLRRLVQIQDGHPETVQVWLAFLRKHAFYGVGMKANVWQYEELEVGENMDKAFAEVEKELDAKLGTFGWNKSVGPTKSVTDMLQKQGMKQVGVPLSDVREASQTREQRI